MPLPTLPPATQSMPLTCPALRNLLVRTCVEVFARSRCRCTANRQDDGWSKADAFPGGNLLSEDQVRQLQKQSASRGHITICPTRRRILEGTVRTMTLSEGLPVVLRSVH
jgi:hypothetical protein